MPIGVLTNCFAVLVGGLFGSLIKNSVSEKIKSTLPILFGFCSIAIGVNSIIKASSMTPVVLAIIIGYIIGHSLNLEKHTKVFFTWLVEKMHLGGKEIDMEFYVTAVALFCCSGFGWYSALSEGITGDPSLLMSKAVLDGFTAMIFACELGKSVCVIPLPQVFILFAVFLAGKLLANVLTPSMFADLSACGGVLTLAAGFRVSKIKSVELVDLMPALILVMPLSLLWTTLVG